MQRSNQVLRACPTALILASALAATGCGAAAFQPRSQDIPVLERQVARSPGDAHLLTRLGAAYHADGRNEEARRTLQQAVESGSAEGAAHLYLGLASEELGDWSGARSAYEAYLRQGGTSRIRNQVRGRLAIVSRQEIRALARQALAQEALLSQQAPTPNTVAVMPFVLTGLPDELAPLRTALADMIITDLSFTSLRSVERVRVQSMIDEMVLTQAGYTTAETGARMGRLLRAQTVVQGLISGSDNQLAVNASVLNTEQRAARDLARSGQVEGIFTLQKEMVFGILDALGIVPTAQERDAITGNRTGNLIAFVAYGRGLEAMDRGDYSEALNHFQESARLDPTFRAAQLQRLEAQHVSSASSAERISEIAVVEIGAVQAAALTQQIVDQVNYSPSTTMTQQTTQATAPPVPPGQSGQVPNPTVDGQQQSPLSAASTARLIFIIPRPGGTP
jgi:tetratricopeptide (TPR) repeat protein